jgi:glycosyltransferase involved in cell wall biosynthesis
MRILAVTNLYPNPLQPHRATFNRQQFRALAGAHDLAVIAPIAWTDELAARWAGKGRLLEGRRVARDGLTVVHPRYLFPPRVLHNSYGRCYLWSIRGAFRQALREFRPDLVFATWAYPDGWAAVDLAHRAGLPVVLKVHGSDILLLDHFPGRRRGTVEALRRADRVVAVSRDLARRVIDLGADPDRVDVVYNGVEETVFHPGPRGQARDRLGLEPDVPVVLFVGNLAPVKGVDVLIEACARLAARGERFRCHLIGQGPLRPRLEERAGAAGLAGHVRFHGALPHERLADWYRAADVLALPSHSEGVPNVLLEAVACGLPCVASQVGGVPEVAALGPVRLVRPGDAAELADALADVLARPIRGSAPTGLRGQATAAEELTALFERVVHGSRRPGRTPALMAGCR